ncbi:MAG: hypothetical protein LAO31_01165 [Acidobacteriia bacterium]|nr:hypothetical protein [Terriglobia bacterium]
MKNLRGTFILTVVALSAWSCLVSCLPGQTLKERLEQPTDFVPWKTINPVDQLVQVGQRFKLPMAIEFLNPSPLTSLPDLHFKRGSVLELIQAIVGRAPENQVTAEDQIIHIYPKAFVSHPFNFLNLRIPEFKISKQSVQWAEDDLKLSIKELFYPEKYKGGSVSARFISKEPALERNNVTVSGENLTIREILTRIAISSGNVLWVVGLGPKDFSGQTPLWKVSEPVWAATRWKFIPLSP